MPALLFVLIIAAIWIYFRPRLLDGRPFFAQFSAASAEEEQIVQAVNAAMQAETPHALALLLYDTQVQDIKISSDGLWATGWMVPFDTKTGEQIPLEPGLALVSKTDEGWKAFVPSDPLWSLVLTQIPADLVSAEQKEIWIEKAEFAASAVTAALTGYYLPYAGGDTMSLTQSVGHDRYTPSGSAHYAFDFAKPGYPSGMFDVYAAKGGIVKQAVWTRENGNPELANYIVLEDTSTNPTSYQLYLHFAKDSIPPAYRVVGAPVQRGTKIGIADDTGVSSGNHLHFMVHTNPNSYWGTSVDIQFKDVAINGGRPRIASDLSYCKSTDVCTTTQTTYVSGNFKNPDHIPPTGGISIPEQSSLINTSMLTIQGWAKDENSGIASAQIIAQYNGEWQPVGSPFSSENLVYEWDMCADGVPDGPVSLALQIKDKALNAAEGLPGLVHFTKNFDCPTSQAACVPTANQVAIFADRDFQGNCAVLGSGTYSTSAGFAAVGDNNIESIQVGSNVQTTLFINTNLANRGETFFSQDSSLADNPIGRNQVSSLIVKARTSLPSVPVLIWPAASAAFNRADSIMLSWENGGGASEYQLQILSGSTQILTTAWIAQAYWPLGGLQPGTYSWKVKARNLNGSSSWSSTRTMVITDSNAGSNSQVSSQSVPFEADMEASLENWTAAGWSADSAANHTSGGDTGWKYDPGSENGYDNGLPNMGMLTSPPIEIPDSPTAYLRFYYNYETEHERVHWDQRWVQISSNGGAFENVLLLSSDPMGYWMRSPAISLASYTGQTIQVRFFFATRDKLLNTYAGWYLDDLSINLNPPPQCADEDSSIPQAVLIEAGQALDGVICPGGDIDYYKFQGLAGEQVSIHTEAQFIGSPLDTNITLIDSDGSSPLATNDDILPFERRDSLINYRLNRTGLYYILVRAWDNPTAGDSDETYRITFAKDSTDPDASFTNPANGSALTSLTVPLEVAARDNGSGVSLARFYWHSGDWANTNWIFLGEDWDGSDGWNYLFDMSSTAVEDGIAFYSAVFDWAGNWVGTGVWNLHEPMLYLPIIRK